MDVSTIIEAAGPYGMIIVALGGLGALAALAMTGMAVTQRRVPLAAWLLLPVAVLAAGALGSWAASGAALADAVAPGTNLADTAASGMARAWAPDYLARWVAGLLLVGSAWGAAIGALRAGQYTVMTLFALIMAALSSIVGAGALIGVGMWFGYGSTALILGIVVAVGGLGVTAAAARRAYHEEAFRVAGMRFASGVLFLVGVLQIARGLVLGARMGVYETLATAPIDKLATQMGDALALLGDTSSFTWAAIVVAAVIAGFGFLGELGEVVQKYTIVDGTLTSGLVAVLVLVRVVEGAGTEHLANVALLEPVDELVTAYNYSLPAMALSVEGKLTDVRMPRIGFGDVLVYQKVDGAEEKQWIRRFEWTGRGWKADESPLAQIALDKTQGVLLVADAGDVALPLLDALEKAGGSASLLLRVAEIQMDLPEEATQMQGTLLPLSLATAPDYTTELWYDADRRDLYFGPARVYGAHLDARESIMRMDAAYTATGGKNLQVVVGERARVSQIADLCLTALVRPLRPITDTVEGETPAPAPAPAPVEEGAEAEEIERIAFREGAVCTLAKTPVPEVITAAATVFTPPEVTGVTLKQKVDDLPEGADLVLPRELGAFAWCRDEASKLQPVDTAGVPAPPITGVLNLEMVVDWKGKAIWYAWDDRKTIESADLRACVRSRIDKALFPEGVEPPPAPEGAEGEEVDPDAPPPGGKIALTLEFK